MTAPIVTTRDALRAQVAGWKAAGARVGVVPTMGALHDGHLSLVRMAKSACDRVIVTIFVNPKQFNNPEDLEKYPRTERDDAAKLAPFGVDAIYVPTPDQIYPDGFATTVSVAGLDTMLCGAHRPGHFDGVATVVSKLFLQTGADQAFFGEKDYQQLQIVRRMAGDLDLPTQVIACPTVREASGLAMSSRNRRLSPGGAERAAMLYPVLRGMADALSQGAGFSGLVPQATEQLQAAGFDEIEYLELRAASGLAQMEHADRPARVFFAGWIEGVRLIDNVPAGPA
ncbi:MAG: pantoate--beta-alanine ligase [Marinibacterium sp.]|nr:pantoate--beta-alanine ligase [Marinibacterium sp.]